MISGMLIERLYKFYQVGSRGWELTGRIPDLSKAQVSLQTGHQIADIVFQILRRSIGDGSLAVSFGSDRSKRTHELWWHAR
jgi:hypothetical protein